MISILDAVDNLMMTRWLMLSSGKIINVKRISVKVSIRVFVTWWPEFYLDFLVLRH